jgi:hypothetical protein
MGSNGGKNRMEFKYTKSPEYRLKYVNGAFGGPSPKGEIKIDFFIDHNEAPDLLVHEITSSGQIGDEIERKPDRQPITRELQVGIIMNLNDAKSIHEWLCRHIRTIEERMKEKKT